jgi:ABC-type glycerol-3-phosphate transport system substrate-binding protein
MKNLLTKVLAIVTVAMLLVGMAGVSVAALAQEQTELTIFARTGPDSSDWLRKVAEKFTAETGITVNFIEQGQNGYFTNLTNQLVAGTDSFDLAVTNSTYVGPWAYAGYIEPLDQYMANFNADFNFDDLAFSYAIDGKTFAIPYSISAHFLYYRSDLISEEEVPKTWDEYLALAKKFTKSYNPDSPTPYGMAWTAKAGPEQPKTFYNYLWSLGGEIQVDGQAAVASEAGLKAGAYWEQIVTEKLAPPEIANYSYSEVLEALQTGIVAMAGPYWSAGYGDITNKESPYKDKIKVALLPGAVQADGSVKNVCFTHSYTMVLNANGKNKEAAMKYYEYLTNQENQLAYAKINGVAARLSALSDPSLNREFFDVALKSLEVARYEPLVPYYLEQHDIMNIALSGIMTGTVGYEEALTSAQEQLQELYDSQK